MCRSTYKMRAVQLLATHPCETPASTVTVAQLYKRLGLEGVRNHGTVCGSGERRMGVIRREAVHVHCH